MYAHCKVAGLLQARSDVELGDSDTDDSNIQRFETWIYVSFPYFCLDFTILLASIVEEDSSLDIMFLESGLPRA